jgi:hypothetical protein
MARLDHDQLLAAAVAALGAEPDPSGKADLVCERGPVVVAADPAAFKRIKKVDGYRWVVINREDMFAANTLSLGSRAGIVDADGAVMKGANAPK